jgi:hypothetical protein
MEYGIIIISRHGVKIGNSEWKYAILRMTTASKKLSIHHCSPIAVACRAEAQICPYPIPYLTLNVTITHTSLPDPQPPDQRTQLTRYRQHPRHILRFQGRGRGFSVRLQMGTTS